MRDTNIIRSFIKNPGIQERTPRGDVLTYLNQRKEYGISIWGAVATRGGGLQLRNTRAHVSVQTPLYCKNATAPVYSGGIQAKSGKKLFM